MNDVVTAILYAVVLSLAVRAGAGLIAERAPSSRRRPPVATIVATVVVGVPTVLQFTVAPSLLETLERNRTPIAHGEFWRLLTSLVVQDGGLAGSIFNLVALVVVGVVAEWVWGPVRWTVIALVSGFAAQLWGLVVQPVGAGNSVAVFGLAAAVSVAAWRHGRRVIQVPAALSLLLAFVLLVTGDIHGGAATVGALAGLTLDRRPTVR